jgi:DNA-repair protein complementing XP-A cells
LKAKALRERALAAEGSSTTARTPSGFVASADVSITGRKRAHDSISASTTKGSETVRDARNASKDDGIQAARKFAKFVDHDFSKMTDTKGGFLTVEDDPFNKQLHAEKEKEFKPAHMTLKEWERHKVLKGLRERKEGPFEPGLGLGKEGKKCRECGGREIDWQWEEVFGCAICGRCKEKLPEKYSLLTKTEAKDDYLLTDREFPSQKSGN